MGYEEKAQTRSWMMRFAHAFTRAGYVWGKASPKSSRSKLRQKSFPQAFHEGSLEVNDESSLGGSLLRDQNRGYQRCESLG